MQSLPLLHPSACTRGIMYNFRKRKAAVDPGKPLAIASDQPLTRGRGLTAAASQQPAEGAEEAAAHELAIVASPSTQPAQPTPGKQWEDVGLKVDPSRLLLGMAPSPTADAALVCGSAATRALAARGLTQGMLEAACKHLAAMDARLIPYIQQHGPPERLLAKNEPCFASLAKSICFQQLATAAAAAIYGRVLQVCQCNEKLTPEALSVAPVEQLRGSGLSERKVSYLLDLSRHFLDGHLSDERIAALDDASLEKELCAVRGLGPWSVHMFQMFHLGHPDVLPVGDLGVRRGMQFLYELKDLPDAAVMAQVSDHWRPFRSVGSYYMWRVEVPRTQQKKTKKAANNRAPL